jgi:hypothetical protein
MDDVVFHVEVACTGALLNSDERLDREEELRRLLRVVSDGLAEGRSAGPLFDANGNQVGNYWFEDAR